ncbi:MAG TPA: nucleotidyltransferase family protein [Pseudomonadales bacterium]|nr:nucleotidyltransferase family protein [Pseudomonadales bacterium]
MKNPLPQIDAILLAAGNSLRFGGDKRLHAIDGRSMLQHVIATMVDAVSSVTVVMKQSDRNNLPKLLGNFFTDSRIRTLLLDYPEAGIGSNLAVAVKSVSRKSDGVLVMLADMPYVQSKTVHAVVDAFSSDRIIVPVCVDSDGRQRNGHPVMFARCFFQEIGLLQGDSGARSVLQRNPESIIYLSVSDDGIFRDIDLLQDIDFQQKSH